MHESRRFVFIDYTSLQWETQLDSSCLCHFDSFAF